MEAARTLVFKLELLLSQAEQTLPQVLPHLLQGRNLRLHVLYLPIQQGSSDRNVRHVALDLLRILLEVLSTLQVGARNLVIHWSARLPPPLAPSADRQTVLVNLAKLANAAKYPTRLVSSLLQPELSAFQA